MSEPQPRDRVPGSRPAKKKKSGLLEAASAFDSLNQLFSAIYEGPLESPPWHTALTLLRNVLEAQHVTLILRPPSARSGGVMVNTDTVLAEATASYQTHFFALDPFVGLPEGRLVTPDELLGRAWSESEFYREYMRPLDVGHLIGSDIRLAHGIECRFRVARPRGAPPFSPADKALCEFLLPHLKRSLQFNTRLEDLQCERQFFAGVVNRLQLGLVSFAADGAMIDISAEARRILDEQDGIALSGGVLSLASQPESRALRQHLRDALARDAAPAGPALVEAMSVTRPSGRGKFVITIRSVPPGAWSDGPHRPAAVMYIRDPETGGMQSAQDIVRRLFGLTRMEAGLAVQLSDGLTVEEAADTLGITRNTARTYLRRVFVKTGVTRQSLLVRKLMSSVALVG